MMRLAILASMAVTACAAVPADGGIEGVSDTVVECEVTGQELDAVTQGDICGIFRSVFAERLADRWSGLGIAVDIRTLYLARIAVTGEDGRKVIERDLSIMDSSLNRQAFEGMAKSMAIELSAGD